MITVNDRFVMQWSDVLEALQNLTPQELAKPAGVFDENTGLVWAIEGFDKALNYGAFEDERDEPLRDQYAVSLADVGVTEDNE